MAAADRGIAESGSSGLLTLDPHDRHTWRSCMRSTMHAASQLPGRGPTDVDVASVPAYYLKNLMILMMMMSNITGTL